MTAKIALGIALCLLTRGAGVSLAQGRSPALAQDTSCSNPHITNTGRALLCGRIVDRASGRGVAGGLLGGNARFVRTDGAEMNGPIRADGTFSLNVAGGSGTLTLLWSCRAGRIITDTITLPPGTGRWREFRVAVVPADTLCRVVEKRTAFSEEAVSRWLDYGPCLRLTYGPWRPALGREYPVSRWIRLESAPSRAAPRRVLSFHDSLGARAPWRTRDWEAIRGDSLELRWSTGFAAVTITLGMAGDSLVGSGLWTFDVIKTDSLGFIDTSGLPRSVVSARRTSC